MARRSRLHPGTRYLARGINSCSGTGEMLSDFIFLLRNGGSISFQCFWLGAVLTKRYLYGLFSMAFLKAMAV